VAGLTVHLSLTYDRQIAARWAATLTVTARADLARNAPAYRPVFLAVDVTLIVGSRPLFGDLPARSWTDRRTHRRDEPSADVVWSANASASVIMCVAQLVIGNPGGVEPWLVWVSCAVGGVLGRG
jgi:hypothetical protein